VRRVLFSIMVPIAGLVTTGELRAQADSREALWIERNQIYKAAGYCFKTARAIQYFGNPGCRYNDEDDVPLSRRERERIVQISRIEQQMKCR
jgi:YARHG domain